MPRFSIVVICKNEMQCSKFIFVCLKSSSSGLKSLTSLIMFCYNIYATEVICFHSVAVKIVIKCTICFLLIWKFFKLILVIAQLLKRNILRKYTSYLPCKNIGFKINLSLVRNWNLLHVYFLIRVLVLTLHIFIWIHEVHYCEQFYFILR